MEVKLFILCISTLIIQVKCQYQPWPPSLITIQRKELLQLEQTLWKEVSVTNVNEITPDGKEIMPEVNLIGKFEKFGDVLRGNFSNDLTYGLEVLEPMQEWREVEGLLRSVFALYETFRRFQKQQTAQGRIPSPRQAWIDFTDTILNHQTYSIPSSLEKVGEYVKKDQLFLNLIKDLDSNSVCVSQQSANQLLYNLYNTIALTEMKGYAMMQFSYMLLEMYGKGTFSTESQMAREKFVNRSIETAQAMGKAMEKASPHFWRCDPEKYQNGDTYLEITQLLQGYVQNEVDLNPDGTCKENCGYYQFTKSHSCYQNLYCRKQRRCKGRIFNCQYVDSDMWICPANITSGRRYNYIEYESGRVLGHKQSCNAMKVESWWRWLFWHCSYCMCLCDEEGIYSDRYISLRSAVSDVEKDKIVTGLRFVKKNRIIHLQVQQGTLSPHGVINASTIEWVPVDDMKITDRFVYNREDYFTLNWENRAIDLDDLHGKDGAILTGIRFKTIGSHLNFEIRVTPFDFESGTLVSPQTASEWLDNINTEYSDDKRTRISINKVDVPTKTTIPSQIKSTHNQFIEFTHTDYDKDAAQTTVPFIDSQNVVPILPMPASGAGIYFKSTGNYGGFIGLKLVTYDFSKHLNFSIDPVIAEEPEPNIN